MYMQEYSLKGARALQKPTHTDKFSHPMVFRMLSEHSRNAFRNQKYALLICNWRPPTSFTTQKESCFKNMKACKTDPIMWIVVFTIRFRKLTWLSV